jgi:hypothetical protein
MNTICNEKVDLNLLLHRQIHLVAWGRPMHLIGPRFGVGHHHAQSPASACLWPSAMSFSSPSSNAQVEVSHWPFWCVSKAPAFHRTHTRVRERIDRAGFPQAAGLSAE